MTARRIRTVRLLALAFAIAVLAVPAVAFAFDETTDTIPGYSEANCGPCHQPYNGGWGVFSGNGVHGLYDRNTTMCTTCHGVHATPAGGKQLLIGATVTATCNTCHDGTGGGGVYGTLAARGLPVGQQHRTETTSQVPGGDSASGGGIAGTFSGLNGTLTCTDCHNPHGSTIQPFLGDRRRIDGMVVDWPTTRLLRHRPGDSTVTVTEYGSDWCLACHRGRGGATAAHNHPADASGTVPGAPRVYRNAAILTTDGPSSVTTLGEMGMTNRGYLMPYPRTAQQIGHFPICQQCHEDPRYVGDLVGTQADPAPFTITNVDGVTEADNPRIQNFPHETSTTHMLIEEGDDLCTNCHPASALP